MSETSFSGPLHVGTNMSGQRPFELPVIASAMISVNAGVIDCTFFTATRPYQVFSVRERHTAAGTDAGAVTLQVTKCPSGTAPASGTALLSATLDMKGTANTNVSGALSATVATLQLAAGDSLALDFTGVFTTLAGVNVTVELRPI